MAALLPQQPAQLLHFAPRQYASASRRPAVRQHARPPLGRCGVLTHQRSSQPAAQAASNARVLVKPTYLPDAGYAEVAGVALEWRLAQLHAHVQQALRLRDVGAAQLSLRLAKRGGGPPDAAAERAAARLDLDPTASLAAAGVVDGSWLLVDLRSAQPRGDTRRNITLLLDLLDDPKSSRVVVPHLSAARLQHLLTQFGAVGLIETLRDDAPLLGELDELRDGATYYIRPADSQLGDKVCAHAA